MQRRYFRLPSHNKSTSATTSVASRKSTSVPKVSSPMQASDPSPIPDIPIILFLGGPGGGKTRHAARVQQALSKFGLVHVCMPDLIRAAIAKYRNIDSEWMEAAERYYRGF
ncbi:unnamed protein product [Thelazia callipaeda]|uniref:Adenylate kinase n=1 Tax=Thelazia callipaeda TaxID=103827 RepID=A0A0N5CWC1_THECL|nr:unnamed protein product [Thelazia callipaeda]